MYFFYGFFQTDVLTFSSRLGGSDYMGKFRPGSTKEVSRFAGMKPFTCSQNIIYEKFITLPASRQNEAEFHPGQPGLCNHHLRVLLMCDFVFPRSFVIFIGVC